jgi:integrase
MALTRNPTAVWIMKRNGKRGMAYRLHWIDPRTGRWASEAAGRDLAYARLRRDQIKQELREGLGGKFPTVSLTDLAGRLDALMAGRSRSTIEKTQDSVRLLDSLAGVKVIGAVDRGAIMTLRAKRLENGAAPATVNKDLRQIRAALSYAVDAGLLRANPLLRWKGMMLREPEKQVRVVEENEFARLVKVCENPTLAAMLEVAYRQGLRRNELVNLRWAAVDLDRRILHVVNVPEAGELTKSRKNRSLPMHPAVHTALSTLQAAATKRIDGGVIVPASLYVFTWPDGQPFKADWVTHWFDALVAKAKIADCSIHDLRRSFSTLGQRAGVDRSIIKDLGGWSCVAVVEKHYTGDVAPAYREAMDRMAKAAGA